jgi:flagellar motor switch protein FliN
MAALPSVLKNPALKAFMMNDMTEAASIVDMPTAEPRPDHNLDLLSGVAIRISVEVGSTAMRLSELLNVVEGSVIELDRAANDLLDLFANGTLIAKGEIVSVEGRYGIRVVEVVGPDKRLPQIERRR